MPSPRRVGVGCTLSHLCHLSVLKKTLLTTASNFLKLEIIVGFGPARKSARCARLKGSLGTRDLIGDKKTPDSSKTPGWKEASIYSNELHYCFLIFLLNRLSPSRFKCLLPSDHSAR